MPWLVRFRGKTFAGDEFWDSEFEFEVREALKDRRELSGSADIIISDDAAYSVSIAESTNPDEFPYKGVHGTHDELGEVFIFYGMPDNGDGDVFAFYENSNWGARLDNEVPFKGDGS
ncbi:hypothetical protein [Phyllobacterium sp. YR531]|uniref:hypothetical protein n=1 Tax=Phyllobacterium sp. YR531 TaxID=1144343 RepID=UPI00026FA9D1|nr:hypothetical protein [Phyllobacterium sp. YR531]EJN04183.1 hypothetical protein PMI41_01822 [Phyllobacterium sp. YR531]